MKLEIDIPTPAWSRPLLEPARYKGAKGGRAGGRSHFFAGLLVEEMVADPELRCVCIREIQRSLRFSAKSLIELKIREFGVSEMFRVLDREIRRVDHTGICIFEGMQDYTADNIKSLEGFGRAWVEEAQSLSRRSLDLLLPTIRREGSQIWFSWNPDQPEDPVEQFLGIPENRPANAIVVHSNFTDNPFVDQTVIDEARRLQSIDPDAYEWIWLGGYNRKRLAAVLGGKWRVAEFEPEHGWDGPYHGADFGFAQDPATLVRCWLHGRTLYIEKESYRIGLELDKTVDAWRHDIPDFQRYVTRADSAEPKSIRYLQQHGAPRVEGVSKWPGSVEDGVRWLRQLDEILISPDCTHAIEEARLWSYKVDRHTGDILPELVDAHNNIWDAVRYACQPYIAQAKTQVAAGVLQALNTELDWTPLWRVQ